MQVRLSKWRYSILKRVSSLTMKLIPVLLAAATVFVQAQARAPQGELQTVTLTVTNSARQYVNGLKESDFIVEENGARQQVAKFAEDSDTPISMGFLIDKSASMRLPVAVQGRDRVPAALLAADGAARVVVKLMKPQDEYLIMTFDDGFQVRQTFTSDKQKVTDWLYKNNTVGGATRLYHAVGEALKETKKKAKYRKRALVVITDVHDTSGDKIEDLQAIVREQETPVYTFGMRWDAWGVPGEDAEPGKSTYEEAVLKMIAGDSGGQSMVVDIPDLLSDYTINRMLEFVQVIGAEVRGQYTLSYYSTTTGPAEAKAVRVRSTNPSLQVRTRRESNEKSTTKK
jgi:VWFA-related protein